MCIKGEIRCKIPFYMVIEHKCVLVVCVHNHPNDKILPVLFFYLQKSLALSQIKPFSDSGQMYVTQAKAPPFDCWPVLGVMHCK